MIQGANDMPMTPDGLRQMIEQNFETHEEGHNRLRVDIRSLDVKVTQLDKDLTELRAKFVNFAGGERMTDFNKIRFSPQVLAAFALTVATIVGSVYGLTSGLRDQGTRTASDVRDILTHMASQSDANHERIKLQDERDASMKAELNEMKQRQELWKYDMQTQLEKILARVNAGRIQ